MKYTLTNVLASEQGYNLNTRGALFLLTKENKVILKTSSIVTVRRFLLRGNTRTQPNKVH